MILPNWHPIFVHFTVALLSITAVFHVLAVFMKPSNLRDEFTILARWTLWLGAGITIITVIFGFWAYNTVEHDDPSHAAMKIHRNWAVATFIVFLLLAALSIWKHHVGRAIKPFSVVLLLIGTGLLGYTAWRGAEVVYRYGIGVMALPKLGQHGHSADMQRNPTMTMTPNPDTAATLPPVHMEDGHAHDE